MLDDYTIVSVPYRGLILFNGMVTNIIHDDERFPSPIGDLFYLIKDDKREI